MKKKEEGFIQGTSSKNSRNLSPTTMRTTTISTREKKMTKARPSVPFHIPDLPRPQDEFNIFVNNSNQPFEHVWLQRSEDGTRVVHPLEMLSESDIIEKNMGAMEPVKPHPMENTPFKLVEEVKELKQLAAKLRSVDEFAVDLEHNQYRSFQGLTCLMQISTRVEDYVVDTLKLRVHIGPYLREVFKDPSKKKVMHGADRDIVWLQRDFGIYVCNLFDTQQASRVLNLERNSLQHLLLYFCGVDVDKVYQTADWRQRPLPEDMIKYAREDTHYLLYIYDLMRRRLLSASMHSVGGNDLLLEVYRRSSNVCMQLYEKELLTSSSYLYIYGLQEANFNSQQLSTVAGLCEWRDTVARAEDESTGYILPNKILLEIARKMPLTVYKLRQSAYYKYPYVEANLDSIVEIIKSSIQNAAAFESTATLLKERHHETASEQNIGTPFTASSQQEGFVDAGVANRMNRYTSKRLLDSMHFKEEHPKLERETVKCSRTQGKSFRPSGNFGEIKNKQDGNTLYLPKKNITVLGQPRFACTDKGPSDSVKAFSGTTKEVLDKLGNAARNREIFECSRNSQENTLRPSGKVEEIKKEKDGNTLDLPKESSTILGQTRHTYSDLEKHLCGAPQSMFDTDSKVSSFHKKEVNLLRGVVVSPFQSVISNNNEQVKPLAISKKQEIPTPQNSNAALKKMASLGNYPADQEPLHNGYFSNLSSMLQKCLQLKLEKEDSRQIERAFDYSAAMGLKHAQEGKNVAEGSEGCKSLLKDEHNHLIIGRFRKDEVTKDFQQAKKYQALLHTGK